MATPAISHGKMADTKLFSGFASRAILMGRATVESMLIELASLHLRSADRFRGGSQVCDAFDVRGLRKHVQRDHLRHSKDIVSAQNVQISGHRGGLAGNVNDLKRSDTAQQLQ